MPQNGYSSIIMLVALFVVMYFMMIRPQKKKEKETQSMRNNISIGDEVITIGGIHGKVVKVSDEIITLELPHAKQRIEFSKWAVGTVNKKGKETKNAEAEVEDELPEITDEEK